MNDTDDSMPVDDATALSQAEIDMLLEKVAEQIDTLTFNPNDYEILKQMVEGFVDSRGLVRLQLAETLGEIGEPATPFLLEGLANHANPVVRRACAKTLTIIADPSAVPALIVALLEDEDTVVKGSSVGALARMGETAVPELLKILESPEHPESTKGHAAWALAFIGAEAKELLYQALEADSGVVRAAVVGAIAKIIQDEPKAEAFEILINALSDPIKDVRSEAAAALGNLAYEPAIPDLTELLQHAAWVSRKSAALALMKIGNPMALDSLKVALSRESEVEVQKVLQLAIAQLEKCLKQPDNWD